MRRPHYGLIQSCKPICSAGDNDDIFFIFDLPRNILLMNQLNCRYTQGILKLNQIGAYSYIRKFRLNHK